MTELRDQIADAIGSTMILRTSTTEIADAAMTVVTPVLDGLHRNLENAEQILRSVELDRDAFHREITRLRDEVAARESFIDKIAELATMGGQSDGIVRRWILAEFERTGKREKK